MLRVARVAIATGLALFAGMTGAGTATAAAADDACVTPLEVSDDQTVRDGLELLCLVNAERAKRSIAAVRVSRQLTRAARGHSRDMVARQFFSHVSPNGMTMRQRVVRTGYMRGRTTLDEALACGTAELGSPAELMRTLMTDAPHKRILLDRRFRDVGIGLVSGVPMGDMMGAGGATLTLNFGRRS